MPVKKTNQNVKNCVTATVKLKHKHTLQHPAETSNNSDICDFLKVSDIENSMVVNGKMYILNIYFLEIFTELGRMV